MSEWIEVAETVTVYNGRATIKVQGAWIEGWEPEGGSAGILVELNDGRKMLIGHLNQSGGSCGCCNNGEYIIRYKRVYQPGPGEGWGE